MFRITAICLFLSILFNVLGYGYVTILQNKNTMLENEKNGLKMEIQEYEKKIYASDRAEKTIGEIRTVVRTVKSVCNCYDTPLDDSVINILRNRNNNDKKTNKK